MTDTIDQTLWYKIRYTPLRDALRGRLTGRLDLRRPLEASALPVEIKSLLRRVVKATRLWRLEQLEVLQELIAHFKDGIAAGVSADELMKTFGDERQAAQLIRRAKRRNRPLPWHALRLAGWSMAASVIFYGVYAVYFFSGRPSPRVNYIDVVNKAIENTPLQDRGWTFYRRALIGTDLRQPENRSLTGLYALIDEDRQTELTEFVRTHQAQIEWIREGAAKPQFGWVSGAKGSANDSELWPGQTQHPIGESGEPLAGTALPPLSGLRYLAMMLRADGRVAGRNGDGRRMLQDIHSTLDLSQQVGEKGPLLLNLIAMAIREMAMEDIEYALREHFALIRNEDWLALNRRLSEPKVAGDLLSFEPERIYFDDMLQRSFTDDGSGNGRLTPQGVAFYFSGADDPNSRMRWWEKAAHPVAGLLLPSRRKLKEEFTRALDLAEGNLKLALRDTDWRNPEVARWWVLWGLPAYKRSQNAAERLLGHRDGVAAGIALELYRQEHGGYPESLNALVPEFLSEAPIDRVTGAPAHYRVVTGQPLIYSVGADRKDDEGRYILNPTQAGFWDSNPDNLPKGDWVLYPTVKANR
jgi:hypothetical protein